MVKNPNWQKADQLAIYQHGRKSELFKASEEQFHWAISRATLVELEFGVDTFVHRISRYPADKVH